MDSSHVGTTNVLRDEGVSKDCNRRRVGCVRPGECARPMMSVRCMASAWLRAVQAFSRKFASAARRLLSAKGTRCRRSRTNSQLLVEQYDVAKIAFDASPNQA